MDASIRKRLLAGFVGMLVVVVGGTLGYWILGDGRWSLLDCLYMTIIGVTTAGFGEVLPGMEEMPNVRVYTIGLLVFGTGMLLYFVSTITAFVVEGDLKRVLASQRLRKRISRMKDHIVVCGAGTTGRNIIGELLKVGTPVVAVDLLAHELEEIAARAPRAPFSYVVGDATDDDVMAEANLASARGLVAALASDKDNLYLVVAARQAAPQLRIVARCSELANGDKLRRAGADSVVSPNFIGGMRMVSEMVRPQVVRFLDDMMRDQRAAYRVEEIVVGAGSALDGATLGEADVHRRFGMHVIATRGGDDEAWTYNPGPLTRLGAGAVLVVVGSQDQVRELRAAAA